MQQRLDSASDFRQSTNSAKLRHKRIRTMYQPAGVKTSPNLPIPDRMKAWVLDDPDQLTLREKPVPVPALLLKENRPRRGQEPLHGLRDRL